MTEDGWVSNEAYEGARRRLVELEGEYRVQCDGNEEDLEWSRRGWPFREREKIH